MLYTCSICGQIHEGLSAIAFNSPYNYECLSEEDKSSMAELSSDFCIIKYEDQTDRFIRVVLKQKIIDEQETLDYGVWVSVSEKSFLDYKENFDSAINETTYFGYLCNKIPGYENTLSIKTNVETALGNERPEIFPHTNQMDNDFVIDYYNGITLKEVEKRIHEASAK